MSTNPTQPKNNLNYSGQEFLQSMASKKEEDDDQNFIKKDEPQKEQEEKKENTEKESDNKEKASTSPSAEGVVGKLKNWIFPKNNQVRTLDNEVGGLETKKKKPNFAEDIWDDRPEEVAAMVSKTPGASDLQMVVNKKIHRKLQNKKEMAREALAAGAVLAKGGVTSQGIGFGTTPQTGYVARLKTLRQDRGHETNNKGGGGMWR